MGRCVCCACQSDDDCCQSGWKFTIGTLGYNCAIGTYGPYETSAECSAAANACTPSPQPFLPVPVCFCESGALECCPDGICRETCEDEELPP